MISAPGLPVDPYAGCASTCELLYGATTRNAILAIVMRRLIQVIHRQHPGRDLFSWAQCRHDHCLLAHDAIEGKLKLNKPNMRGVRTSVSPIDDGADGADVMQR
jgi:hypothetical protein